MTALEQKITYFKQLQTEIMELHKEAESKTHALESEFKEKVTALEIEYTTKNNEVTRELDNKKEKYRAELKATFGMTDGEKTNVLDVIQAVQKATALNQ